MEETQSKCKSVEQRAIAAVDANTEHVPVEQDSASAAAAAAPAEDVCQAASAFESTAEKEGRLKQFKKQKPVVILRHFCCRC
jgi:hypothetical protein